MCAIAFLHFKARNRDIPGVFSNMDYLPISISGLSNLFIFSCASFFLDRPFCCLTMRRTNHNICLFSIELTPSITFSFQVFSNRSGLFRSRPIPIETTYEALHCGLHLQPSHAFYEVDSQTFDSTFIQISKLDETNSTDERSNKISQFHSRSAG